MKIVIVGGGAIGCFFGVYFAKSGHEVVVLEPRREVVDAINTQGIGLMAAGSGQQDEVTYVKAGPSRRVRRSRIVTLSCSLSNHLIR